MFNPQIIPFDASHMVQASVGTFALYGVTDCTVTLGEEADVFYAYGNPFPVGVTRAKGNPGGSLKLYLTALQDLRSYLSADPAYLKTGSTANVVVPFFYRAENNGKSFTISIDDCRFLIKDFEMGGADSTTPIQVSIDMKFTRGAIDGISFGKIPNQ